MIKKKLVYICAPFRADTADKVHDNIAIAKKFARKAYDDGLIPIVPHVCSPAIFGFHTKDILVVEYDLELLKRCDLMWVCGDRISKGMQTEINFCKEKNIKIEYHAM